MKYSILSLTFLLMMALGYTSEKPNIDSLEERLTSAEGLEEVKILNKLAVAYKDISPFESKNYAELAFTRASELKDNILMAEALMNIGNANWLQFSYNVAIEKYKQAAKLYKLLNDSSNLALAYS
ncbi:MAG: hypothetical protein HY738_22680, partial [Bacteroidia bacterium]|nr:hypothetical protein [Bacteroidia bacterium]